MLSSYQDRYRFLLNDYFQLEKLVTDLGHIVTRANGRIKLKTSLATG